METIKCVFVVTRYQNIVGVYANLEDATQVVKECVAKNQPANISTMPLVYSLKSQYNG